METEAASHLWPSQRAGYLLEGRGLITTRWAKSAQMVLLKLFPSAQRPAPPEVSWQDKGPHFSGASPTPSLTPLPLPPFQRRPEFQLQPRHELLPKNNSRPALFPLPTSREGVERSLTPRIHLDLWNATWEENLVRRLDQECMVCTQKPSSNGGNDIFQKSWSLKHTLGHGTCCDAEPAPGAP